MTKKRRRHTGEQILRKLAEGNKLSSSGQELTRCAVISESRNRRGMVPLNRPMA
jgi:hypothetical protein